MCRPAERPLVIGVVGGANRLTRARCPRQSGALCAAPVSRSTRDHDRPNRPRDRPCALPDLAPNSVAGRGLSGQAKSIPPWASSVITFKAGGAYAAGPLSFRQTLSCGARRAAIVLALLVAVSLAVAAPAAGQSVNTVVSLAFDRAYANQVPARAILTSHGMDATFYVNSGTVGQSGYMTWTQLQDLRADGNEIGGETINHTRLTQVTTEEARRQVCDDRAALVDHGFAPRSFAYPYSLYNATVQQIVRDCGYSSGRTVGYLADLCSGCPYAESIPPADPYAVRTPDSIKSTTTLDTIKAYVTQAETHGGGWVVLIFPQVCNACATHSITQANLTAFLDWLEPRAANGTVVKTVGQVMQPPAPVSDITPPTSSISCNASPCSSSSYSAPVTVGLSATDDQGGSGVSATRYTTDGSEPTASSPTYVVPFTISETTTIKFRSWDAFGNVEATNSQLIQIEIATQPTVVSLTFDDGYADNLTARAMLMSHGMDATFYVNSGTVGLSGNLTWTQLHDLRTDGNEIAGHTLDHTRLTQLTTEEARRQVCDDRAALVDQGFSPTSFAYPHSLYNATVQQIVRDCGYSSGRTVGYLWDVCSGCPYAESIPPADPYAVRTPDSIESTTALATIKGYVTQAETHGGGWVVLVLHHVCTACATHSITEGDLDALLDWLEPRAANGTVVKTVGEVMGPPAPPPVSDTTPPTSSITCNGSTCSTAWYPGPVTVALSATDGEGGSGVSATRYTTDGSEPTAASPAYVAPFTISETTTVEFRSWDAAGNMEATKSQTIRIDATPPSVALTSPIDGSRVSGTVSVTAVASDAGSGIARVAFYVDGILLGTKTGSPYRVQWNTRKTTKGEHVLYAVATDVAGNSQSTSAVRVIVD
jgi:peptidoglycan/xylan/chitin deacetylase (PgdA/CDA1 family)